MMRLLPALLAALLLVPTAAAEFGRDDTMGWPLAADGTPTFPGGDFPGGMLPEGPLNQAGPFTLYPYYPVLTAEVQRLAMEHPDLVKLHSLGKSTLGLDLWMLEIADFENPEMLPLDAREVVWVDGGTHSNEYSGVWFAAHLASFLADGYATNETATWIVENRHTWIMPLVNPDGSHAFGRLNAKGVNVNRNYPVDWGANNEDPLFNNPGPAPASEVETQHNIAWFNKTQPDLYVSVHCCGNLWLYPYGVEGLDPLDQQALSRICDEAFPTVREDCGPIWSTIYPASGSSVDTVYEYTGAAAFGYEMSGRGAIALWGQPFTSATVEEEERESWEGLMHGFLNVHKYGAYPVVTAAGIAEGQLVLRVRNDGYGNLTNASLDGVALPFLGPGAEADITLPRAIAAGALALDLVYEKRHMAGPEGILTLALELREGARGFEVVSGEAIGALATEDAARVPFMAPVLLLAVALLVAARRTR
jgi:hypothetical protein